MSKVGSDLKWSKIVEEEETVDSYDENIKLILKLKANAIIFSDESDIMGAVKPGAKAIGGSPSKTEKGGPQSELKSTYMKSLLRTVSNTPKE